jgi:hypothetical protein
VSDNLIFVAWCQKMESKSAGSKHVPAERKTGGEKMKLDAKDQSFWVLMEGVLADALTPAEASAVITKMKKVSSLQMVATPAILIVQ